MRTKSLGIFAAMLALVLALCVFVPAARSDEKPDEWKAPPRAEKRPNPVPADAKSLAAGKTAYTANCLACHGVKGKGDGPAAVSLERKPGDLSSAKVQQETDGALFWKITEGRKPMPSFEKLLSETQRWQVVNYVRTFAPPATQPAAKP